MSVVEVLTLLKGVPGTLNKKSIIKANNSPLLETIFNDTYDESRKYNVKKYEVIESGFEPLSIDNEYHIFHELLNALAERKYTGNEAVELVGKVIGQFAPDERWILDGILKRNLKVGVSLDNYNDAVGKMSIQKYEVALADKFFDLKPDKQSEVVESGMYLASRKLDGVRCNIHVDNTVLDDGVMGCKIDFISRQGKAITTLDNLKPAVEEVCKSLVGHWVLDGEVCITDDEGNENFLGLMSEITRKDHTIKNPKFKWFDLLKYSEFLGEEESPIFSQRYSEMIDLLYHSSRPKSIEVLKQDRIHSWDDFNKWSTAVSDRGWEGFMLKKDAPYKKGRSKDLLKVKKFQDAEYIVEDVVNGRVSYNEGGTKEYDAVSSLVINHKGNKVYVGSGLSKEQRLGWYEHPEEIIGKTITVQYFEETQDKKTGEFSLRFPILKVVYEDGRNV